MLSEKLVKIQSELVVPKSRHNNFGNYSYRSLEDILEAVKPLLAREGLILTLSDTIEYIGDCHYVKATARLTDGKQELTATAYAREAIDKKGMDPAQSTGAQGIHQVNRPRSDASTSAPAPSRGFLMAKEEAVRLCTHKPSLTRDPTLQSNNSRLLKMIN